VVLTAEQGSRAMHIMAAAVPPAHGPPLQLLPTSGVRWSDLRRAMGTIAMPPRPSGGETLTAVVASDIGDDRAWFELLTSDGWPAVVRATRCGDGIQLEAWMGPYPTAPEAVDAARSLQAAAAESLRQWGRKPELPAEAVSR
jgi:hypothetical protein